MNSLMRSLFLFAVVAVLAAGGPSLLAIAAPPPEATITVHPTGLHPQDSLNVQAALDAVSSPGTVILKSTNALGTPTPFNFGGTDPGTGAVIKLLRPDITLTGDGWDTALDEPKTIILGGGGPHTFSTGVSGMAMNFAIQAPGVTIRELKITSESAAYTCFYVSSFVGQASVEKPVVIERNHVSVINYGVLSYYTAPFAVHIRQNRIRTYVPVAASWLGFALAPIAAWPNSEPVPPRDASGDIVRRPYSITDNVLVVTPETDGAAVYAWGWSNANSQSPDPDVGVRRMRPNSSTGWTYQHVQGENGPVLISGNQIVMDSPDNWAGGIVLGSGSTGLNNSITTANRLSGIAAVGLEKYPYGHNNTIEGNDFTGLQAWQHVSIDAADTTLAGNAFGPLVPFPPELEVPGGLPQPVTTLISVHYSPLNTPVPHPVANCAFMKNDYRDSGARVGAVLVASQQDLGWAFYPGAEGGEVKDSLIFESGGFLPGTGQAGNQILVISGMENPATGLPYVHDIRVVGTPARDIAYKGIGAVVQQTMPLKKLPDLEALGR